jgi:hypothetical protein
VDERNNGDACNGVFGGNFAGNAVRRFDNKLICITGLSFGGLVALSGAIKQYMHKTQNAKRRVLPRRIEYIGTTLTLKLGDQGWSTMNQDSFLLCMCLDLYEKTLNERQGGVGWRTSRKDAAVATWCIIQGTSNLDYSKNANALSQTLKSSERTRAVPTPGALVPGSSTCNKMPLSVD